MRIRFFRNMRYKYKLLASLIIVFFVPLIFTSAFFLSKIQAVERINYITASEQLFQQSSYNMGLIFEEIHRTSNHLLSNKDLKVKNRPITVIEKMEVRSEINNYILNSSYLSDLALYAPSEDKLYFSDGTSSPALYFGQIYQYRDFDSNGFYELVSGLSQPTGLPEQPCTIRAASQSLMTIFIPLSSSYFDTVIFTIPSAKIVQTEEELLDSSQDVLEIYYNGILIHSSTSSPEDFSAKESIYKPDYSQAVQSYVDGNHLSLVYSAPDSLVQIVLERDLSTLNKSVKNISLLYITLLAVFSLIGCCVIVLLWRDSYRPIAEVLHYTAEQPDQKNENEFDRVKKTLISIKNEQEKLNQNLETSIPAYRKSLLTALIKDEFDSLEEFNEKGKLASISLHGSHLFILALSIVDSSQNELTKKTRILEEIISYSEENIPQEITCCGFVDKMNEKIIYTACTELCETPELQEGLLSFHNRLHEYFGFEMNIGCSSLYDRAADLSKAYMEALTALDYRIVFGYGKIIYFSQIGLSSYSHSWYPQELTRQFEIALKCRNEDRVHMVLDQIMEYLHNNNTPLYVAKYVCYDLMRLLADSLVVAQALPYKKTIGYHNIMNIARLTSFEQITEILHQNVNFVLSSNVKEQNEAAGRELKQKLEQYIEKNFADCNFSMTCLADEFHVSESTMRKSFKSVMNMTFIEYLAEKRIDKAKGLLTTTKLPLNSVAQQVGYLDTSSFIRRFKQKTGMPPGEYRMVNRME